MTSTEANRVLPQPAQMETGSRKYLEQYASLLVSNRHLRVAILCVTVLSLGLLVLNLKTVQALRSFKPRRKAYGVEVFLGSANGRYASTSFSSPSAMRSRQWRHGFATPSAMRFSAGWPFASAPPRRIASTSLLGSPRIESIIGLLLLTGDLRPPRHASARSR